MQKTKRQRQEALDTQNFHSAKTDQLIFLPIFLWANTKKKEIQIQIEFIIIGKEVIK